MNRHALWIAGLLLPGLGGCWAGGMMPAPPFAEAEQPGRPYVPEEAAVRRWVRDNTGEPFAVAFDRWGPHDLKGKLEGLGSRLADLPPTAEKRITPIVRVVYRETDDSGAEISRDLLFVLLGSTVIARVVNRDGDDWQEAWRVPPAGTDDSPRFSRRDFPTTY